MIEQSVLGWAADTYNDLVSETGDIVVSVTLEQYSLSLTEVTDAGAGAGSSLDTADAIVVGETVVRAWPDTDKIVVETLPAEEHAYQSWSSQDVTATGIDTDVQISLAVSGNTIRAFFYDGTNIKYVESTNAATNWGAAQTVGAKSSVKYLGAAAITRCHYITLTSKNNSRLGAAEYDGSWTLTDANIYWQFYPSSFDALEANQADDGAAATNDIIAMTTDFPPMIGVKIEGTELVYTLERVQGIALVRYQNGKWSHHYEFDLVDNAQTYPSRYGIRLTKCGNLIHMTYHRVDGEREHSAIALTRSKTGIEWEIPYLITDVMNGPVCLVKRGSHAYLVDSNNRYRSPSVGFTGDARVTQDITDYVVGFSSQMGDIQQGEVTVANPNGVLDSTSPFSTDAIIQLRLLYGYNMDGTDYLVQTLLADVYAISGEERIPTDHAIITSRDVLSRMMVVRADEVNEWESHRSGGDNFKAIGDTIYSGIRHTAAQRGRWTAEDEILHLASNEADGVAFCTYLSDAWNGSIQVGGRVAATDTSDFWGVCFRAHDANNFWGCKYQAEDDRIYLFERIGTTEEVTEEETRATYSNLGWTYNEWKYMKVNFAYGYINVYTSEDGVVWTHRIGYECAGVTSRTTWEWGNLPNLSGRVGYIGHGYSSPDTPGGDDGGPGPIPIPDPPDPDPPTESELGQYWGAFGENGFYYSDDVMLGDPPTWTAFNTGITDSTFIRGGCADPNDRRRVAIIDNNGDIHCSTNAYGVSAWVSRLTKTQLESLIGIELGYSISPGQAYIGDIKAYSTASGDTMLVALALYWDQTPADWNARVIRSSDWGNSWTCGAAITTPMVGSDYGSIAIEHIDQTDREDYGIGELVHDGTYLWLCGRSPRGGQGYSYMIATADWGETWASTVQGDQGADEIPGPMAAGVDSNGKIYLSRWQFTPAWDGNTGQDATDVGYSFSAFGVCCSESSYQVAAEVAIPSSCDPGTYYMDIITIAPMSDCEHPSYGPGPCTATFYVEEVGVAGSVCSEVTGRQGVYHKRCTINLGPGDIPVTYRAWLNLACGVGCGLGSIIMSITGPTSDGDNPCMDPPPLAIASGTSPTSINDLSMELELTRDDGIADRRGMLDVSADDVLVFLKVDGGETTVYLDSVANSSSLSEEFRVIACHGLNGDNMLLGRSWVDGEEAAVAGTDIVYRSNDGGASWEDASGNIGLKSVTGLVWKSEDE